MDNTPPTAPTASTLCACATSSSREKRLANWTAAGGLIGSLGLCAACCLLPFALALAGAGSAWIASLEAFARYKELFLVGTLALLGFGFYVIYWKRVGRRGCNECRPGRAARIGLWIAAIGMVSAILFEYLDR